MEWSVEFAEQSMLTTADIEQPATFAFQSFADVVPPRCTASSDRNDRGDHDTASGNSAGEGQRAATPRKGGQRG